MKQQSLCIVLLCFVAVAAIAQLGPTHSQPIYSGKWWLSANHDTQAGFLEGAADCLTWVSHEEGFNGTADQLQGRITAYYKKHPEQQSLLVAQVWQEVWSKLAKNTKPSKHPSDGETWNNPHWYLDGNWWGQGSIDEEKGFIEGFLWCMRSRVKDGAEGYPLSDGHYFNKVEQYIRSHPDAGNKPVANILARFCARPTSK
jgi:hypothetical protein